LFGYDRATFDETIEAFHARLHPDDVARVAAALQSAIDSCGAFEAEYRVLLPTGETRWIAGRGKALPGADGRAVRLLGAAYDTTRQRQGDARVARVARVLEVMNAAFFSLDRDWRFTYVNAEAERVLHHRREELLGGNIWELFPYAVGTDFEVNYRGAAADGRQRVFEAHYPPPLAGWQEVRAWPSPDGLSVYFLDITERRAADRRAAAGAARLAAVADVTAALSGTRGPGQTVESLLEHALRAAVPVLGDWMIATLVSDDGHLRDAATWHRDLALRPAVDRYAAHRLGALHPAAPLAQALTGGQTVTLDDAPEAEVPSAEGEPAGRLSPGSAVVLPLVAHGRSLGALSVYRGAERAPMDGEDLAAARQITDRAALALDNLRLHQQQARLAEMLQRSMLTAPPQPDHEEIAVRYHPAVEVADVGGDWYDAFEQADGATMLVIGDVVGHDMQAAVRMGQLRGVLRGIAQRDGTGPADVLCEIDAAIERLHLDAMATAAVIRLEQTPGERAAGMTRLRWSNAGHPPPLLLYPDGRTQLLAGERAELMLGVHAQTRRSETTVDVPRGATLLLYTDGLVEDRDLPLDEGISRLRAALADLAGTSLDELCDQLLARLWPGALHDDIALVALRLHPQDRPRPTATGMLPARLPRG
jgi:PAS domain S-box-containing protein